MTEISFQLSDDSKLPIILNWLKNQEGIKNIKTDKNKLTRKQVKMKKDLEKALNEAELHAKGEMQLKSAYDLLDEL